MCFAYWSSSPYIRWSFITVLFLPARQFPWSLQTRVSRRGGTAFHSPRPTTFSHVVLVELIEENECETRTHLSTPPAPLALRTKKVGLITVQEYIRRAPKEIIKPVGHKIAHGGRRSSINLAFSFQGLVNPGERKTCGFWKDTQMCT
jgi:hypothetical protein